MFVCNSDVTLRTPDDEMAVLLFLLLHCIKNYCDNSYNKYSNVPPPPLTHIFQCLARSCRIIYATQFDSGENLIARLKSLLKMLLKPLESAKIYAYQFFTTPVAQLKAYCKS